MLARAVIDGLALGSFDRDALTRLDEWFYERTTETVHGRPRRYHDDEHVLQGLWDWEAAAVERAFPDGGRIAVTGAGAGREVHALLERGFDAVGYEPNATLVEAGRQVLGRHGHADRLRPAARDAFPAGTGALDGVLIGWGSYMLIPARRRRLALLAGARAALGERGSVVLSFGLRDQPTVYLRVVRALGGTVRALRRDEPVELGDALIPNFVHLFSDDEIQAELSQAGLALELLARSPYGHAVARKP